MKPKLIFFLILLFSHFSYSMEPLSSEEKKQLSTGQAVKRVIWKEGYVWPEVVVFKILEFTPKENLTVFLDYETHKNFIPDMLESKVVKKVSPNESHIYFEMEMPWPVKKTSHTTRNVLSSDANGNFKLTWNLIEGKMLKSTDGYMEFSTFEGKTLLTYVSQIVPNSSLAGMFKNRVAEDVEKSVDMISRHLKKTLSKKTSTKPNEQFVKNLTGSSVN